MTGNAVGGVFAVCVVLGVVAFFAWIIRAGGKLVAKRDAELLRVAKSHGLTVKRSSAALIFAAEGTAGGAPLRLAVERVNTRSHGTREVLRVVARTTAPRPAISVHRRDASERNEFDRLFVTGVDDDAAALDFLSTARADLLPFEGASLSGVQSFKVGKHLERAVDLILRLASNASGYRAG